MRIISGIYRGRQFRSKAPKGVRPTADAVRESMFNVLNNLIDLNGTKVLDICAGTGALGIESLSRGADYCNFIEKNGRTARAIKNALTDFKVPFDKYKITVLDAEKALANCVDKYDLIFFDPPYFEELYDAILKYIHKNNILSEDGVLVVEYDEKLNTESFELFDQINVKTSGSTKVSFLENNP